MLARRPNPIVTISVLFLVIVIDQMGITFIYPILTPLFMHPTSNILPAGTTIEMRDFLYSLCLALYPLMMFVAAPLLGNLSDQVGRKIILLICLLGSAASFLLSSIAINLDNIVLLLISRAIAGFFSGSQYIAQAAIVDISPPEKKALNLSYVVVAISVGMIFGPLIGAYFSDTDLAHWLTYATPFEVAALLAVLNAILLSVVFSETMSQEKQQSIQLLAGLSLLGIAFISKKIRLLSLILVLMMLAWTLYFQTISWILFEYFHFNGETIGLFMGYIGLCFATALMIILPMVVKNILLPVKIIIWCLIIIAFAFLFSFTIPHPLTEWLTAPFIIGPVAIAYTILLALFSNTVSSDKQGWIMGVTGSLVALAWILAGIFAGLLGYIHLLAPLLVSLVLIIFAILFAIFYARKHAKKFGT